MATQAIDYRHPIFSSSNPGAVVGQTNPSASEFIGVSEWADDARELIALHSAHNHPVILEGEMGTGRRFLARLIHRASPFRDGPFISLRMGSASDEMAQGVLFGLLGGSALDASTLQSLNGSTIYIEDLSYSSLYACEGILKLSKRLGSLDGQASQFRILIGRTVRRREQWPPAAIATDGLEYERIQMPALRHRPEDIEPLIEHFIKQHCEHAHKEPRALARDAIDALKAYDWPRNISELKTLVNRLLSQLKPPSIDASQLPAYLHPASRASLTHGVDLASEVERFEISLICNALRHCQGQQNRAARLLGIKPTTLFMKLKRYSIDAEEFKTNYRPRMSAPALGHRVLEEAH